MLWRKNYREREREQLKYLVEENIIRLSSLNANTPEIYRKKVLPRIIEILLDSKGGNNI